MEVVAMLAAGGVVYAVTRHTEKGKRIRATRSGKRAGRLPRKSRLVVMYNNTGAKKLESDDAATAAAELAGRVIGRGSSRAWRAARTTSERRWAQRETVRPAETVLDKWRTVHHSRPRRTRPRRRKLSDWFKPAKDESAPPPQETPPPDQPREPVPPRERPRAIPDPDPAPQRPIPKFAGDPEMSTPAFPDAPPLVAAPPDWAALIARVTDFEPENDTALMRWMASEAAGVVAYAEALEQARANCVAVIGLDPSSVSGIGVYSEHMSEAADRVTGALARFKAVYREVLELASSGVVMPYRGRWMTGGGEE
ncbi:hypothetical protein [Sphaerisporangium sp. TRM90804]|uniref:hypothetical protein n=1 Tax=Sphaerisporangium sp. TRM90804 TaxID=3031113 RepID=UPI00244C3648|nr:hypothetical protein [Sphaerisporangium sp. TRM90804]MDH2424712.1 hypothetical protein [Sphaerisporangium sp. TRM90804]